ncbi:MAG: M18 family aminopeptidase [Clostridia bacterium]|nr:M18 family aminopeptidase [Clostridia bacterium]
MNRKLFDYIAASPTAYHAVEHTAKILSDRGYSELREGEKWSLEAGKGYYVTRNCSSLIAFKVPSKDFCGFMMTASHSDSPTFKVKENPELSDGKYLRLSVEKYGGMLCSTWMDRPLSVAGRVTVRTENGFETKLVDLGEFSAIIPNVAIHMNRNANDGMSYNPAVDMLPLFGEAGESGRFMDLIAEKAGSDKADIITTDLFLYNLDAGKEWGSFITAPRLDDLQCAFASLQAFAASNESESATVYCLFDNEEVGSGTKQGAASTFLYDVLYRINSVLGGDGEDLMRRISNSFLVSCDNAHAVHPNHPEFSDKNHTVTMNGGIVIKYNANQKYTTDAVSSALFRLVCEEAGVPVQSYANRADMPGGSTLGNIANTQVSLNTVDIGLAQLAMHSALETAGAKDTEYMVKALTSFYNKSIIAEKDGSYRFK